MRRSAHAGFRACAYGEIGVRCGGVATAAAAAADPEPAAAQLRRLHGIEVTEILKETASGGGR
jgi:hypothetical protein